MAATPDCPVCLRPLGPQYKIAAYDKASWRSIPVHYPECWPRRYELQRDGVTVIQDARTQEEREA